MSQALRMKIYRYTRKEFEWFCPIDKKVYPRKPFVIWKACPDCGAALVVRTVREAHDKATEDES